MANQYLRGTAPDAQVLVNMRPTNRAMNRSNWFRSFLMGAAIATLISLITIRFFEWYLFTVVDGLAVTLSPISLAICITAAVSCFGDEKEVIHASPPSIQG